MGAQAKCVPGPRERAIMSAAGYNSSNSDSARSAVTTDSAYSGGEEEFTTPCECQEPTCRKSQEEDASCEVPLLEDAQCNLCGRFACANCLEIPHILLGQRQVFMCCGCLDTYFRYGLVEDSRPARIRLPQSVEGVGFYDPMSTFVHLLLGPWKVPMLEPDRLRPYVTPDNFYVLRAQIETARMAEMEDPSFGIDADEAHLRLRRLFREAFTQAYPGADPPEIADLPEECEHPSFFPDAEPMEA